MISWKSIFAAALVPLMSLSCQSRVMYKGENKNAFERNKIGVELRFESRYGTQSAYYIFPRRTGEKIPARLLIAYPGITALALEWLDFLTDIPSNDTGFLLIEYPGRGNSEGTFRPKYLNECSSGALKALCDCLGIRQRDLTKNMVFLGHSFGSGAALQFAVEIPPKRVVLVAPFNTFRKAAFRKIGPLAWILPDGMDNCDRLKDLCRLSSPPKIIIFHGSADETLPVTMSRDLVACSSGCVEYYEIENAGHIDILHNTRAAIINALFGFQWKEAHQRITDN